MEDLLEGLNEAQRAAVTATEGFVRVIAGAGSGKTRALSHRFAFLVNELGILPGNILCVTFTNKSAAEMRQRIHRLTGDDDTGYINTFHGFCVSVLQEDSHAVGYPKSFLVLDNADIDAVVPRASIACRCSRMRFFSNRYSGQNSTNAASGTARHEKPTA